ncbi:MAG TPA: DUF2334 domain-containing protein [Ruminiclostridium sp.]|nr:DUF2334 domain-containing protein [Ruminiclostridium sp.]
MFRYDDYSWHTIDEHRLNVWQEEQKIDASFKKYNLDYVISIIPFSPDRNNQCREGKYVSAEFTEADKMIQLIKNGIKEGRIEPAQHGYSHKNNAERGHEAGEFCDLDFRSQLQTIRKGKEYLCEALEINEIKTFVPPWNKWEANTIRALEQSGFQILSADRGYYCSNLEGLTIIPYTSQLWELEAMLEQNSIVKNSVIVVLYHPEQLLKHKGFERSYFGVKRFEQLLAKVAQTPGIKVLTIDQLAKECNDLNLDRYFSASTLWQQRNFWRTLLPENLWPGEANKSLYLTTKVYNYEVMFWVAMQILFAACLVVLGLLVRNFLRSLLSKKLYSYIDIVGTFIFCMGIIGEFLLFCKDYQLTGIRSVPVFFGAGFIVALVYRVIKRTVYLRKYMSS